MLKNYTLRDLTSCMKEMELALGLLDESSLDEKSRIAYEVIRFPLFVKLSQLLGIYGQPHEIRKSFWSFGLLEISRFLMSATFRSWLFLKRRRPVLLIAHPRSRWNKAGYFEDIYSSNIAGFIEREKLNYLEPPNLWTHYQPTLHPVKHTELHLIISGVFRIFSRRRVDLTIQKLALEISQFVRNKLGVEVDVESMVYSRMQNYKAKKKAYRIMLKYLRPKVLFNIVSYFQEELIVAARELGIKTVEIQHGVITEDHMGYSVPRGCRKITAPDEVWLWGKYWRETVSLSQSPANIKLVGFPYLDKTYREFIQVQPCKSQVLVISQGTIGLPLSRKAVELAKLYLGKVELIYKLHPGEVQRWRTEYSDLLDASASGLLKVVEDDRKPLYELFAESRWIMGVYSTAIFEGIFFGCQPIIVKLPGYEYMIPLIERYNLQVIDDINQVDFGKTSSSVDTEDLFCQFEEAVIIKELRRFLD